MYALKMWLLRCKPLGHSKWLPDLSQINSCGKLDTHHPERLACLLLYFCAFTVNAPCPREMIKNTVNLEQKLRQWLALLTPQALPQINFITAQICTNSVFRCSVIRIASSKTSYCVTVLRCNT